MTSPRRRGSILIVEDDPDHRELLTVTFKAAGFHVVAAGDGVEALRVIDVAIPTAIVLDLGLPRVSGGDVAREIAAGASTRDIPIVVVTGLEPSSLPPSIACVLHKPVAAEMVVAEVERCVSARRGAAFRKVDFDGSST